MKQSWVVTRSLFENLHQLGTGNLHVVEGESNSSSWEDCKVTCSSIGGSCISASINSWLISIRLENDAEGCETSCRMYFKSFKQDLLRPSERDFF